MRVGSIDPSIKKPTTIELPTGERVTLEPVIRTKRRLGLKDFDPCTILLNNDLSAGVPGILEEVYEQYQLPPLARGMGDTAQKQAFQVLRRSFQAIGQVVGGRSVVDQSDI